MARIRRTNQDNSRAPADDAQTSGQGGVHTTGPNLITMSPVELARIISEAVKQAMARKEASYQVTPPGGGHENEQEQQQELREEEEMRREDEESSAGSKSPTVAEVLLELRQKMKVLKGQLESRSTSRAVTKGCPFAEVIVREPLPGNFKSSKVKEYDGNADPEEHLARFENMAMLHCYTDRIKCKVFLTTLVDSAQRWFEGLAPQSIHSFKDFKKVFSHHFNSSKKYKKTVFSLFEVKQSPEESLRAYIRRFNRVAMDVPTCVTETKTNAFTQGLREGKFFKSLTKKVPGDFEDLLSRAEKYINMEEAQKHKREAVRKERGDRLSKPEECSRDLAPDYQLSRPEKRGFCTLHKVCYHNTEDCKTLKGDYALPSAPGLSQANKRPRLPPWTSRQPESSSRGGDLRSNPRNEPQRRREPEPERKKNSPPVMGVIKMISGGSTDGDSNRARKSRSMRDCMEVEGMKRNEAVISFGPEDLKGVNLPHNDALVIQARVAKYDVMRVFIDSGSSVNVIFKEALIHMDLHSYHLEAVETALFGFVVHVVYSEGEIVLPLTLGSEDLKKTVMTSFTVVDSPSLYNIILGRQVMNELRAVASTYHQKIKFSMGARVGEVRGDQPSSQKCYVKAVRADQSKTRREEKKARVDEVGGGVVEKGEVHFVAEEEQEGYHQIPLAKNDQDKVNFITSGGATYQRLMNKVFEKQRGRNVEVYVDDILGKSKEVADFIADLEETFATLNALWDQAQPCQMNFCRKEWQVLGVLRKAQQFGWDEKCEQAFQDLKIHLAELPVLVKPEPEEKLFVYLSTTEYAVSSVLIKEEGSDQKHVYYVSHALRGPELRYSEVEKIALALIMTARKLRPYFLSHQIVVLTNSPLGRIMTHSEVSGRMIKWTVELGEYDIEYKPGLPSKHKPYQISYR
ncbi:uncharacterized protein LOC142538641 [Primulina tabacum]|uniref:uncharacterized protein LOC142538641 n=1 Tax=Primulina tabacum TaxID=48773 RepID=UPI003F5AA854